MSEKVMSESTGITRDQFRHWVLEYSDMLYGHAIAKGFDNAAAKDLVQDTFLAAWRSADRFEGRASVKNWLFVILKNKITDHFRQKIQRITIDVAKHDDYFDGTGHWAKGLFPKALVYDPAADSESRDFHQILDTCSGKLNTVQRAVFWMKYIDEMESNDICGQLSISPNNYWTTLHRAKVQLRACIEKNWFMLKGL